VTGTGNTDLNTKTLAFRLEPKLVLTTQGQGSTVADPIGLGVPVIMEGTWSAPRIYPDVAGILDNPDAAFGKLKELGQGLFGPNFFGGSGNGQPGQAGQGNKVIESIGSIIQGLAGGSSGSTGQGQSTAPQAAQPAPGTAPQAAPAPAPAPPPGQRQSQDTQSQIDNVIRQLFGR
jgi:AsmA protein